MPLRTFRSTAFSALSPGRTRFSPYSYQAFPTDNIIPRVEFFVRLLLIAGGGGGGFLHGGGAGAGGFLPKEDYSLDISKTYPVVVGAGGVGGTGIGVYGTSGRDTAFDGLVAIGGGAGGPYEDHPGLAGGSGGGGERQGAGGLGTPGQGNNGGPIGFGNDGSGGGGAGAAGGSQASPVGGAGLYSDISGANVPYAGGGGGAAQSTNTAGGIGGGGGGMWTAAGTSGTPNTGGGGGGGGWNGSTGFVGGHGGSGVFIISYPGAARFTGGVITTVLGRTIHTFTASGSLTPI